MYWLYFLAVIHRQNVKGGERVNPIPPTYIDQLYSHHYQGQSVLEV